MLHKIIEAPVLIPDQEIFPANLLLIRLINSRNSIIFFKCSVYQKSLGLVFLKGIFVSIVSILLMNVIVNCWIAELWIAFKHNSLLEVLSRRIEYTFSLPYILREIWIISDHVIINFSWHLKLQIIILSLW